MGKKSKPPKAPDLKPISDAQIQIARESNELAREFMGISREQFAWMQQHAGEEFNFAKLQAEKMFGLQEKLGNEASARDREMLGIQRNVADKQLQAMDQQMGFANEDRQRWRDVFVPMQDRMIAEANAYDTPERREAEAGRAMADVSRQIEAQRGAADQRLRGMGIDPSQVRSSSMVNQIAVAGAANQAMAGNQARQNTEDRGRALRADAINMGMGLPSQAATGFQGSANSGNVAVGAANAANAGLLANYGAQGSLIQGGVGMRGQALGQYGALTGSPGQWASMGGNMMGQASNAYGNAGSTLTSGFNSQMSRWQAGQQQGQRMFDNVMKVGSMVGGMMMAEGGAIERERFDAATPMYGDVADVKTRVQKPNRDLQLGLGARAQRALAGMADHLPADTAMPAISPVEYRQHQFAQMPVMAAEGYAPRGALPVRQQRDRIPATLGEGEYVLPADVVRSVGLEKLDKLVAKYHRPGA